MHDFRSFQVQEIEKQYDKLNRLLKTKHMNRGRNFPVLPKRITPYQRETRKNTWSPF